MSEQARDRYVGNFIESADLMHSDPVTLAIADAIPPGTEKSADGRLIDRPIIAFEKTDKRFILSKTNERLVKAMHGSKPRSWTGQPITLTVRYLPKAFGETNVPTVRVVLPDGVPMPMACRKHYGQAQPISGGQRG